jgi:hypothetical protein
MRDPAIIALDSLSPPSGYQKGLRDGRQEVLDLLRSDECYYEVAGAKESWWAAIEEAAVWAEGKLNGSS